MNGWVKDMCGANRDSALAYLVRKGRDTLVVKESGCAMHGPVVCWARKGREGATEKWQGTCPRNLQGLSVKI